DSPLGRQLLAQHHRLGPASALVFGPRGTRPVVIAKACDALWLALHRSDLGRQSRRLRVRMPIPMIRALAGHPSAQPALDTMLRGIRTSSTNWLGRTVMGVVMGLLALSFAVWGIN